MDPSSRTDSIEITDYPAVLRRRWKIILIAMGGGLLVALVLLLVSPKTYTSQASIQVTATGAEDATTTANGRSSGAANLDTEAQIVKSAEVASLARELLKSQAHPTELARRVTVTVPPNSTILNVAYDGSSPVAARDGARSFAQAYLDNRIASARERLDTDIKAATDRITKLNERLATVTATLRATERGTATKTNLQNQQRAIVGEITALNQRVAQSNVKASNITAGSVITGASLPESPSNPNPRLYLPGGLMAGLLIGLVLAVLRDRADKHLRRPQDVERMTGLPVLLTTPFGRKEGPLGLQGGRSLVGQNFNQLAHLVAATLGHGNHVILVTGAAQGNGPGIVAANLAAAFARTESKVMLICANLESGVGADVLGVGSGPGLAEVLLERKELGKVAQPSPSVPSLAVITPGIDTENAVELLQRENMERLIERMRRTARYLIVETAPTTVSADAQALADAADAAVMVVEIPRTRYDDVNLGLRQLDRMGTAVLGAVCLPEQTSAQPAAGPLPHQPAPAPVPAPRRRPPAAVRVAPAVEPSGAAEEPDRPTTEVQIVRPAEPRFKRRTTADEPAAGGDGGLPNADGSPNGTIPDQARRH